MQSKLISFLFYFVLFKGSLKDNKLEVHKIVDFPPDLICGKDVRCQEHDVRS